MAFSRKRVKKAVVKRRNAKSSTKQLAKKISSADDVYLTRTKIAVRQVRSDNRGRISSDTTKYFPKTKENLACAGKLLGRVRYGR